MSEQELTTITSAKDILFSPTLMQQMDQISTIMASSAVTVPKHLQGNKGDCFAIALQASQWGMNPFAVAQKTHLVNGTLGYEAQLINAVITTMAPTKGRLQFEWFGDWSRVIGNYKEVPTKSGGTYRKLGSTMADEKGCGVKVWATLQGESEPRVLELLLTQATTRNSTLWSDDPKQQLAYLAIKRWSRLYCPDVIMGVYSADELEEIPSEREINPMSKPAANNEKTEAPLTADDLLIAIRTMSPGDFKNIDPTPYSDDERLSIRKAMTERKRQVKEEQNASVVADVPAKPAYDENTDWAKEIKQCGDNGTLTALLDQMPEIEQLNHSDLIDAQFDSFR